MTACIVYVWLAQAVDYLCSGSPELSIRVHHEISKMTKVQSSFYQTGLLLSWLLLALEGPVAINGQGKPERYLYCTYTITNLGRSYRSLEGRLGEGLRILLCAILLLYHLSGLHITVHNAVGSKKIVYHCIPTSPLPSFQLIESQIVPLCMNWMHTQSTILTVNVYKLMILRCVFATQWRETAE